MRKYNSCTEYWMDPFTYSFRSEFEQMYKDIEDPWGCEAGANSRNNRLFLEMLFPPGKTYKGILDTGCGLGALTKQVHDRNGGAGVTGLDISKTAVDKASKLYPQIPFRVFNVLKDRMIENNRVELIILAEVIWYILEDLTSVLDRLEKILVPKGILAIHQFFPSDQKFGKLVINGLDEFMHFMRHSVALIPDQKVVCHSGENEDLVLLATFLKN